MVVRKRRKVRRQRGGRSHGWGVQKDHKSSGMRGGKGNAGLFSHRWIQVIKEAKKNRTKPTGRFGFLRPQQYLKKYSTINVSQLNQSIDTLVDNGRATLKSGVYTVDLGALGIKKLLAQGEVTRKMNVIVEVATERAVSKIEAAGGSVELIEN